MSNPFKTVILSSLRTLAQWQLQKNQPLIVGITGSAGKSACVNATARALEVQYQVKHSTKGNSETGVPLEILNIPIKEYQGLGWLGVVCHGLWQLLTYWPSYEILVAEMGIDSDTPPKNMGYLLSIVQPTIGVFLNVNEVHGQNFAGTDKIAAIAREKGKLLLALPPDGLAVYSQDHPAIVALADTIKAPRKTFSHTLASADAVLKKHRATLRGTTFEFTINKHEYTLHFDQYCLFKEAFGTFAAALLVADSLHVPLENAIVSLERKFRLLPGRMSMIPGINGSMILDSSYNSSPEPTKAALHMLREIPSPGKKIAVLGDMRELGTETKSAHESLAATAVKTADVIVAVGPYMKEFAQPYFTQLKFPTDRIHFFTDAYEAIDTVTSLVKKNDVILVKGSQNTIFLEIIVKALMKHPKKAEELLCRQSPYWDEIRLKLKQASE